MPASRTKGLDLMLMQHDQGELLQEAQYWSSKSTIDIFDVSDGEGILYPGVSDEEARCLIESDSNGKRSHPRIRLIFVDGMQKEPNKLTLTSSLAETIFKAYDVTPRFSGLLATQEPPGRVLHFDPETNRPARYELWYTFVVRSRYNHGEASNISRKILDWSRFAIWADFEPTTGDQTCMLWRCPGEMKKTFFSRFEGVNGAGLLHHPMILHSFFVESIISSTRSFLRDFSNPLYNSELMTEKDMFTAEDYTNRSQTFLKLSRQLHQIATDYDILEDSIEHLQKAHLWFEGANISNKPSLKAGYHSSSLSDSPPSSPRRSSDKSLPWSPARVYQSPLDDPDKDSQMPHRPIEIIQYLADGFERYRKDVALIRTYSNLYLQRTAIGVNECFAMVNQRDAEINIKMAAESTTIARRSHQDSRALRIIQILTMVFLPASLVSSIFGMGFFSTSQSDEGGTILSVSGSWWWYLAISFPLTAFTMMFMGVYHTLRKLRRRAPESYLEDTEAQAIHLKEL